MKFAGIEKNSLVDFDGRLAYTLFTSGCNFKCKFCHNSSLISGADSVIDEKEVFKMLSQRQNIIDAVVVSGGEPTLHPDLINFIKKVKELGFETKLDTNGTNPELLREIISSGNLDYVAMDIKNSFNDYNKIIGGAYVDIDSIIKSAELIRNSGIEYEFRTTLVEEYHSSINIETIATDLAGAKRMFLQKYESSENCLCTNLTSVPFDTAMKYKAILEKQICDVRLRGY